jgi:cytoskeletal protein CcmA (bactofilin family)
MADSRITEIGAASLVKGEIEAQEDVSVFGRVEGTVKSTQTVTIEEEGLVDGEIEAANVVIAGVMIGNIRATARVEVLETGVVQGDIATPVMVLLDGGAVKGHLVMDDSQPEPVKVNTTGAQRRPGTSRMAQPTSASRTAVPRPAQKPAATGRVTVTSRQAEPVRTASASSRTAGASRRFAASEEPLLQNAGGEDLLEDKE